GNVIPVGDADEPLVAVDQLLPANLHGERQSLHGAEYEIPLTQIHRSVRLRIGVAFVACGGAVLGFAKNIEPIHWRITDVDTCAEQQKVVVSGGRGGAEVYGSGARAWNRKIGLVNVAGAELSSDVEIVEESILLAQPVVDQTGANWGLGQDGRSSWERGRDGC